MADQNVTTDLTGYVGDFQRECDSAIANLIQVCSAATQAKFYRQQTESFRFGIARIILEHPEELSKIAPEKAARTCFLSVIGKFVTFLDRLIASRNLAAKAMTVDREITTAEELNRFVNECLDREYETVAKNTKLSNPSKVDSFTKASSKVRDAAKAYFQLRRALEHHDDVPEADLIISTQRVALVIDDKEVTALPCPLNKGQLLEMKVADQTQTLPSGKKIVLSPQNAHDLVFTMRFLFAPEVFRSHVEMPDAGLTPPFSPVPDRSTGSPSPDR
jgi:hypothetical protein